jgi:hypothetical protein
MILSEKWIDTVDINTTLNYGDVDFDNSNVNFESGKIYRVEGKTTKNQLITLELINYSNKVVLKNISKR